ncbi:MAG: hypothetical protein J0M08_00770 [Bacteroidetes bacterium]|nr:hypothetical protein [Bacteroidota bacterium]
MKKNVLIAIIVAFTLSQMTSLLSILLDTEQYCFSSIIETEEAEESESEKKEESKQGEQDDFYFSNQFIVYSPLLEADIDFNKYQIPNFHLPIPETPPPNNI